MRLFSLFLLLTTTSVFCQREAAIWYFGGNAGLDFNSGQPQVLLDGQIDTVEGCESFSDSEGNLLFYTEGNNVWNRNHQIMPNGTGLDGSFSTSQSALVIPKPGQENIYFVFTPDDALSFYENGVYNGFNYSVIDMLENNGLGDVTQKNIELLPQGSEKVSAVKNSTANFYWVVTHVEDRFYAYKIDENGVDKNPVVSVLGPSVIGFDNIRGNIKISPDGRKLAISHTIVSPEFKGSFYLFDFNSDTGVVSNPKLVSDTRLYYGVEFSSNSSKLYASGLDLVKFDDKITLGNIQLVQFDLDSSSLSNEGYLIGEFQNRPGVSVAGALQIAIDKKIYHAIPNENLSVLRTPNLKGINVDFRPFEVYLGGRTATYGLPPFVQSFFETIVTIESFCEGNETTFTLESSGEIDSVHWDFGDLNSGALNFSNELNPSHVFSSHGTFTVTMDVTYTNGSQRTFLEFVEIAETPDVVDEVILVQCDVDGIEDGVSTFNLMQAIPLFSNGNEDITGLFFVTEEDAMANINQIEPIGFVNSFDGQEIYARAYENAECFSIVKIILSIEPMSNLETYDTLQLCEAIITPLSTRIDLEEVYNILLPDFVDYVSLTLYANQENALTELEQLKLEDYVYGPFDAHEIYFRVEDENKCAFIGKVLLNISEKPEYEDPTIIYLCKGEAELHAMEGFKSYRWSNDRTEPNILVTSPGIVDVVFGNDNCNYVQTFEIREAAPVFVEKIEVVDFQQSNMVTVRLGAGESLENTRFSLDKGETFQGHNTFMGVAPGIYDVLVDNGCSEYEETIVVGGVQAFFTPNGDNSNDSWTLNNPTFFPGYKISIFDRYGKLLTMLTDTSSGWDGTYQGQDMPADGYWYYLELVDGRTAKGSFTLKR